MKIKSTIAGRLALTAIAAATLSLFAPLASAMGLGRLTVQSSLGEAMRAEIEVTSMSAEESANLKIRVAPPESYRAANVDYNAVLPSTQAVLQRRPDGRMFVRLTSDRGVQEPFVDVILEISWATGRLVREYTLLFDPPSAARAAPQAGTSATLAGNAPAATFGVPAGSASVAPVASSSAATVAPMTARERRNAARQAARAAASADAANVTPKASVPAVDATAGADEYRVKAGDSLSRIAVHVQRQGVSLDQMLVSMFRANPQAFLGENMNRLKSGVVLSVPTADTAQATSASDARQVITAQSADFGAYRQRLAGSTTLNNADGNTRQAGGKVQASVDDRKPGLAPTPDKLTLSKGANTGANSIEAGVSKSRDQKDSSTRVAELSRTVDELKKFPGATPAPTTTASASRQSPAAPAALTVPLGGSLLAGAPTAASPTVAASAVPTPPVVAPLVVAAVPAPPVTAPASSVAAAPVSPASAPATAASSPPVAIAAVSKPVVKSPAAKPRASETSWFESMLDENPVPLALGGLVVLLLAGFGIYRFTKRSKKDSGETSFLESRLQPDSFFGASGGQRIDTRDAGGNSSSMTYSLSQLDAIGDVDPVAEADVYLAYGRDLQAEEILKEAMRSNPERMAIRTKLLEVYAKRRDTKGFELLATQLFALTRGEGEDWAKAQELGAQIDPDNRLFQPGGSPERATSDDAERPEPLGASTMPQSIVPVPSNFGTSVTDLTATDSMMMDLDLDLDNPDIGSQSTPMPLDDPISLSPAHDSTFGDTTLKMPLVANEPGVSVPDHRDEPLAFDLSGISLDLDKPADNAASSRSTAHADVEGIDFPSVDAHEHDPLARKLELAEEFERIGDKDGARDLLREVLATASGSTKTKAQGMLDGLN